MRVLRENKDSLMAVLEAFVHDPLIGWRLVSAVEEGEATAGAWGTASSTNHWLLLPLLPVFMSTCRHSCPCFPP
jgi:phosphatidylinositol kinase/protein kinase (PI-3  family)